MSKQKIVIPIEVQIHNRIQSMIEHSKFSEQDLMDFAEFCNAASFQSGMKVGYMNGIEDANTQLAAISNRNLINTLN